MSSQTECLKDTVNVLINAIGDNDNAVNNVVIKSLAKIANVYPNEVIEIFCDFYQNTVKINTIQLGNIVKVLEQTCVNQVKKLDTKVAMDLVNSMLRAMMENPSHEPVVQMGASSVLVAISHEHLDLDIFRQWFMKVHSQTSGKLFNIMDDNKNGSQRCSIRI